MKFVYNPFTNKLDPTESGGSGGGGVSTINTISPDGSGNFSIVAGSGITVTGGANEVTIDASGSGGTYYSLSPYIVGPDVNSQYTTIQAAITQAITDGVSSSNPKNIYIKSKSSAYAENLTGADGIRLIGLSQGASSSTNDFPNCSVIWDGTLTWTSGTMTIQNIRCAYSGSGTSITVPANGGIKAMNCQIQNSGGTVLGASGDNPVFEFDTCFINAGVFFSSTANNIDFRVQKSYVVGNMTFGAGASILADYCTFGSQINNGTGSGAVLSVVMNFCFITSGILINSTTSTSPGNSFRFNNCYLQNSSELIRLNKGQAILQGCSGQCNSLFDDSFGTGGNSISLFSCNFIISSSVSGTLGAGSQMYQYGCVGINAPVLGSGANVNYYNSLADTNNNNQSTIINSQDINPNASDGFLYLPACNGTPAGTPTVYGSSTPMVYDYAGKVGYVYADGAWNAMGGGGSGGVVTINTLSPDGGGNFTLTAGTGITLTPGTNDITIDASGGGGGVSTLTGSSGGAVSGTNIDTVGSGSITVVGNPGTSTLTTQLTGLTNHAVQVGAGTATLTQVGPSATAGQVFQSAGSSADPVFSTATYPSTATGTGKILRANGTNWVATTATYPDLAGTSGNVLVSNGTNWVSAAGGSGITTINGDSGSITGSTVNIRSGLTSTNCGSTVKFVNSGTSSTLNVSSANNTMIGLGTGNTSMTQSGNTAVGISIGTVLTGGAFNTAIGDSALALATTATNNTALGYNTLFFLVSGQGNTAVGATSGFSYTAAESDNVLINSVGVAGESNVLRIGDSGGVGTNAITSAFINGIFGSTVTGSAVLCDSSGQLGTISSSRKYKENITPLDNSSILDLQPVKFNYISDESKATVYGLIAEEVEEKFPDLVLYKDGKPESIKYHEMPALLLAEIQRLNKRIEALEAK